MAGTIGCHFVYIKEDSLIHSHLRTGQIIICKMKGTLRILNLHHGLPDFIQGNLIHSSFCILGFFFIPFLGLLICLYSCDRLETGSYIYTFCDLGKHPGFSFSLHGE